jgi:hypothetical protein
VQTLISGFPHNAPHLDNNDIRRGALLPQAFAGSPIYTVFLSKVNHWANRGIAKAVLVEGNTYYLRLRKTGLTQEAITFLYSAVRPKPDPSDILEDH